MKLDGSVGILANGAGLAMSTLDVVALAGGKAANFCDLGGGGDAQGVVDALEIITGDPQVESILFNVFGGITRTDEVARGILQALSQMAIDHPIVVRLDGTNAEEGRRLLKEAAPPNLHVEPTMLEAAKRAVELAEMTDVWSDRAEAYRQSPAHREGPGPRCDRRVVGRPGDGPRRRDGRRARRAAAARGRARRDDGRPGRRDGAGRRLARGAVALRGRELRPRGLAARSAPLLRRAQRRCARWRGSRAAR